MQEFVLRSDAAGVATLTLNRLEKLNALSVPLFRKQLLSDTDGMSLAAGLAYEIYRTPGVGPDMRERIDAFMNRKKR
jgi:hypothetical protein